MADLLSGRYAQANPLWSLLGQLANVAQSDAPPFTNWTPGTVLADSAIAATGVSLSVPVAVDWGTTISKITVVAGATAEATGTHSFLALYQGTGATPALIGQTADDTGAASIAASTVYTRSLATAQLITPTNAPNGFVYVTVNVTGGTIPTLVSYSTPVATHTVGAWFTGAPRFAAASHDSAAGATAPATMGTQTAFATAPVVILT
jgi:hypothetical protein